MLLDHVEGHLLDALLFPIANTVDLDVQGDRILCVVVATTGDIVVALQKHACRTLE
jgi:hypothetical protein